MLQRIAFLALLISSLFVSTLAVTTSANAQSSRFGCYKVTANSLNLRKRAWGRSAVVGVVHKGTVVAKRRRWCALRGFWCPVRTKAGVSGWADKKYLRRTKCPA